MGIADDIMNSFFAANPLLRSGELSIEELNRLIGEYQQKINSNPIDEFDGLNPEQMEGLLYKPFAPGVILQFREGMESHINKCPFFKLSELLLQEIKEAGKLKLTIRGNLPVRICELLYNQNLIHWPYMELVKRILEEDVPYLWPLKEYLLVEGIVKKRHNILSFTKNGEKLLQEPESNRFIKIFNFMANRFHWCNFYELYDDGRYGQLGWAYSLVLLSKYGDKPQKSEFYSLKLMQAFEKELWDAHQKGNHDKALQAYHRAYEFRFFENFANWFGLVNIERNRDYDISFSDQLTITKSELFDQLFEVKG
ncbi:hypothetical protein [Pedobacter sp.]|uniref:hypothetical protein n=1 Tax=Pedobacter sp. TaxID=1411316 RepID=UPI003D7FFD46